MGNILKAAALVALLLALPLPARAANQTISPEIEKLLALPEDKIDIGLAALTFAHDAFPVDTDIQAYSNRIDKMVAEVRQLQQTARGQHVPGISDGPDDTILALNEVFYNREGIKYDHSPDGTQNAINQFLPGIIEHKQGICTTMPMLYLAIAQRLGLSAYMVETPQHNFVRITDPRSKFRNIETTSSTMPSDNWYIQHEHISPAALKRGTYMRPLTHRQYLATLLANNANFFLDQGQEAKALNYYRLALKINPQSALPLLDLMDFYIHKTWKTEGDYLFDLHDDNKRLATEYFEQAISYRKQLKDMGINMEDYGSDHDKAINTATTAP